MIASLETATSPSVKQIRMPTLIIHGKLDRLVPLEHGRILYADCTIAVQPLFIDDVGHNNAECSAELWIRIRKFIHQELEHRW